MSPDFTTNLLSWNEKENSRLMPWKGEKDPYKIWLSEIILQQTRVDQGWKYYERFISTFPTIHDLANAPQEQVFKLWEGLGYYSRCKNLIETAQQIVFEGKGIFPATYSDILELKGVGPYTAAAIASFAFNEPRAVVDGNVQRVIARYFGISTPVDTTDGKQLYADLATELLDKHNPALYNQAIMDFGAIVCKPRNPLCSSCVQNQDCISYLNNFVASLPVKEKSLKKRSRWFYYFLIETNDQVYIRKRTGRDIWQNLHEFVLFESERELEKVDLHQSVIQSIIPPSRYNVTHVSRLYKQQLTHQNIHGQFVRVAIENPLKQLGNYNLVEKATLKKFAFPKFINSYLEDSYLS